MDLPIDSAVQRLRSNSLYKQYFSTVFGESPSAKNLGLAIAAFENNLETTGSPFDEWKFSDEQNAVSEAVKRGFVIFNNKGKCNKCHFGANHSTNEFKNIGLFDGAKLNDSGRYTVTRQPADIGKFKTPGLRNISLTAPYMHDGIFRTLEEVIEFYNDPKKLVPGGIGVDSVLSKPLDLTKEEKADLLEFLRALTDPPFGNQHISRKGAK
jgi:cytochrome c peroxidase